MSNSEISVVDIIPHAIELLTEKDIEDVYIQGCFIVTENDIEKLKRKYVWLSVNDKLRKITIEVSKSFEYSELNVVVEMYYSMKLGDKYIVKEILAYFDEYIYEDEWVEEGVEEEW
jgi:hypothetical protein